MPKIGAAASIPTADADYAVAGKYETGTDGTPQSITVAVRFLRSSAYKGHAKAQYRLSMLFLTEGLLPRSPTEASRYAQQSAAQNYLPAVGLCYSNGYGVPQNADHAFEVWTAASNAGDPAGDFHLAAHYFERQQFDMALRYVDRGVSKHYLPSFIQRGPMYWNGLGVPINLATGRQNYQKAAILGSVHAYYAIGLTYLDNRMPDQDPKLAYAWLLKAATLGHYAAQFQVARFWFGGSDFRLPEDPLHRIDDDRQRDIGLTWLRFAAADDAEAQYYLAVVYETGTIFPAGPSFMQIDLRKAAELYRLSAADGFELAKTKLEQLRRL